MKRTIFDPPTRDSVDADQARLQQIVRDSFRATEPTRDGRPRRTPILPVEGADAAFVFRLAFDGLRAREDSLRRVETACETDAATPC